VEELDNVWIREMELGLAIVNVIQEVEEIIVPI